MTFERASLWIGLVATSVFTGGCIMGDGSDTGVVAVQQAVDRADAHRDAAAKATSTAALQRETRAYAGDMHGLLADMEQACSDMMGSGGMNMDDVTSRSRTMRNAVDQHRDRMLASDDLDEMRADCEQHRLDMHERLDSMRAVMSRGGMMGGGMH